ncbi:hypothetical protein DOT_4793 [Desulfosporosinus sp. OT]|nr:hypothetical protein DOT_4793 [Desulfosporosinus sp. OT]
MYIGPSTDQVTDHTKDQSEDHCKTYRKTINPVEVQEIQC